AGAFDCESGTIGAVLGSHGAAALGASCAREQRQSALASRDVIGQAKGILMGRSTVDSSHVRSAVHLQSAYADRRGAGRVSVAPWTHPVSGDWQVRWSWEKTVFEYERLQDPHHRGHVRRG
ncbi:MAG TPA: ANTAR domain-containing protein, partial [Mycobacterium sp.]|nr:ANTAR domain-containing protein [Mycobacterium sp.]